jgi:hypothetical protein
MRRLTALLVLLALVPVACNASDSVSGLTDSETSWCIANYEEVYAMQRTLELKDEKQVWGENRGAKYDQDGNALNWSNQLEAQWTAYRDNAEDEFGLYGLFHAQHREWLEHPDGIRSCLEAMRVATTDS